jgi:hypothetical protein
MGALRSVSERGADAVHVWTPFAWSLPGLRHHVRLSVVVLHQAGQASMVQLKGAMNKQNKRFSHEWETR